MAKLSEHLKRNSLADLQRFVRRQHERSEVCELCAKPIGSVHQHLLRLEKRQVTCACDECAILFGGNTRQRYRRIPRDLYKLENFAIDSHDWDSLLIPINLAFFVYDSAANRTIALYPSPGGAMESSLDLEYWNAIVEQNPVLRQFEPDVEALLVNRTSEPPQYFRAPIDTCFQLVGIIRTHWRGFSGGQQVWSEIHNFFDELGERAGMTHA
jgi:hypothetical protein